MAQIDQKVLYMLEYLNMTILSDGYLVYGVQITM